MNKTDMIAAISDKTGLTKKDAEKALSGMIGQLEGNEFDLRGLAELKALLGGE